MSIEENFAAAVLRGVGVPVTRGSLANMLGWMQAEGGHTHNDARFNFLNTTQPAPGAGNTGSQGNIKVYRDLAQGERATIETLRNGHYGDILSSLAGAPGSFVQAVNASPWGTKRDFSSLISGAAPSGELPAAQAPDASMAGAPSGGGAPAPPSMQAPDGLQLLGALRDLHSSQGMDRIGAVANLVSLVRQRNAAGAAPADTAAGAGAAAGADAAAAAAQIRGGVAMPLGTMGSVIGTPHAGTHTLGNWESDNAVDLAAKVGTPVYAIEPGTIGSQFGSLGSGGRFAGLRLHLDAPDDSWYYAHLSRFAPGIRPGASVTRGQLLGYSGSANGVGHLHLGSKRGDPRNLLGLGR